MTPALNDNALREAEKFLHERIPLTRAMGLRVVVDRVYRFAVEAPVALNYNHLHTAFGGSINAVATLAAYVFLWLEVNKNSAHVVVASSSIRFFQPLRENIRAACIAPDPRELADFHERFNASGKARIRLQVSVEENGNVAAQFEGTFVALRSQESEP